MDRLLQSLEAYSQFVASIVNRPTILRSTVTVWSASPFTGTAEGEVFFNGGYRLRLREELDFHVRIVFVILHGVAFELRSNDSD